MDPFTINRVGQIQHEENLAQSAYQNGQENRALETVKNVLTNVGQQLNRLTKSIAFTEHDEQTTNSVRICDTAEVKQA